MYAKLQALDTAIIKLAKRFFVPIARLAFFIVFFYFGVLKVLGASPATPLAEALVSKTIGLQFFDAAYLGLAIIECLIGILFLIPKATRIVIPLLLIHLAVVCSPLILVPEHTWVRWFVPNLEGQYIIKNVMLVAAALGLAANTTSLNGNHEQSSKKQ